jgi:NADP-dependent 3-hydroxy acid dehydrogenase YdfG
MPRKLSQQTIVITGASSGIGRGNRARGGAAGRSVVLAARGEAALRGAAAEVERLGGRALPVVTDVSEYARSSGWPGPRSSTSAG